MAVSIIADGAVGLFHYTLRDDAGEILDSSAGREPMAYLHGHHNIVPGLESAMVGKAAGDHFQVQVEPAQAYGEYNPDAVTKVHRSQFPANYDPEVGEPVHATAQDGSPMTMFVIKKEGAYYTLTFNHPLAGKTLHFEIEVVSVREALPVELEHGHVHGPGGHHH
jgi:FKBP-type peptidyl-prolyl cis-trans isomerase SlyD